MKQTPASSPEAESFRAYVVRQGLRWTAQRQALLEAFLSQGGHWTAEELHRGTPVGRKTGFATVYRTLKHLVACGLAREVDLGDGKLHFERMRPNEHHDHLLCVDCGALVEFHNPRIEHLQEKVAGKYGYRITHHRLVLYGHCPRCRDQAGKGGAVGRLRSVPKMSWKGGAHGNA